MTLFSGDFDEKYSISLSRYHARIGYILCTHRSWRSTLGQLLKKVAQAKPKGLLHLFVLSSSKLFNRLFHLIRFNGSTENHGCLQSRPEKRPYILAAFVYRHFCLLHFKQLLRPNGAAGTKWAEQHLS